MDEGSGCKEAGQLVNLHPGFRRYLLKGLARCVHCGEIMWSNTCRSGSYYRDPSTVRGLDCRGGSVRVDYVDGQVDRIIERLVLPEAWQQRILALYAETDDA